MVLRRDFDTIYSRKKIQHLMRMFNIVCPMKTSNPYRGIGKATKEDKVAPNLVWFNYKPSGARVQFHTDIIHQASRRFFIPLCYHRCKGK